MSRHQGLNWAQIESKLKTSDNKLWSLNQIEITDGEPDVVDFDEETGEFNFLECSSKTPIGRRSLCYDNSALESRKENKPKDSPKGMAKSMGIELLTEQLYRPLQLNGNFDTKTSSWLQTPDAVRQLGGALLLIADIVEFLNTTMVLNLVMIPEAL